jgi:hypothetical protein
MPQEGPRTLHRCIGTVHVANGAASDPTLATLTGAGQYSLLTIGNVQAAVHKSYFDLSGYQMDDLTTFIAGVRIMEGTVPTGSSNHTTIHDLVTTEFVTDEEIVDVLTRAPADEFYSNQFGYPTSTFNLDQVVYGQFRSYLTNASIAGAVSLPYLAGFREFGVGNATAAEKLYITRIVTNHVADTSVSSPPVAYVVNAIIAKEKEMEYFMRLKRSYEAAAQVS